MVRIKKYITFIVIVLIIFMITIYPRFKGVNYTFKSGKVIDYLNYTVESEFIWITLEDTKFWSERTELSNEEFEKSYFELINLKYKYIKEHKNTDLMNSENVKFIIRLSDGTNKYELLVADNGIIIVYPFAEDGVTYAKLIIEKDELKKLLEELRSTKVIWFLWTCIKYIIVIYLENWKI